MKYELLLLKALILSVLLPISHVCTAQKSISFKDGQAVFILKDHLRHPFYWWPKTLLTYRVKFDRPVKQDEFTLTETVKSEPVDFQLTTEGTVGTVSFISDLPSGGDKVFVLKSGARKEYGPAIVSRTEGNSIIIETDKLSVRIPASQAASTGIPGPVSQLGLNGQQKMGRSVLYPGNKTFDRIITEKISSGPVFSQYKLCYLFKDGAKYIAYVKCVQGQDYVELKEEMTGMKRADGLYWKIDWEKFQPTHRQAPNHPYGGPGEKPGFARFDWEKVDQKMLNSHHGVMPDPKEEGKMPFDVDIYQPWPAERAVSSALFWDEKNNQSVGTFISDFASWNDKDYAIWQSSKILGISFFYRNNLLSWEYPVSEGTRVTGISCYPHQKDIDYMNELEEKSKPQKHPSGFNYSTKIAQLSYNIFLQNRYGTIDLNKVKDWVLVYADSAKLPEIVFESGTYKSLKDLENFFFGGYTAELTFSGTRQNSSYSPVPARAFYETFLDGYNRLYPGLSAADKERFSALFLMHAYVSADEEYMPMKYMLSGHPNFLADVKTIPAMASFLFPEHPEAKNWANLYERYVDLNTRYHTRPDVKAWNAQGGRWTENLSAYTWAFLRPTLQTNYLLEKHFDGKNRVANTNTEKIGSWLLNSLSAPYNGESLEFYRTPKGALDVHSWGIVTGKEGPQRVHPPLGAHSLRRQPPAFFWLLGESLKNYSPLLSENIRYISHPDDDNMKAPDKESSPFDRIMFPKDNYDKGTRPDFKTVKLTGYGNILRANTGMPDELSIHLLQIDQGHNYRWGRPADGGTGTIYFYAGGKSYSHNGKEDIGDRKLADTDLMTNFGVFKDGTFKSIGQNVLSRPLYDLGNGQFTELIPSQDTKYSWPEYQSRSLMLVGSDYFITYDDVYNKNIGGRFSWFTHPDEELPVIEVLKAGGTEDRNRVMKTEIKGPESKGVHFDGSDDFMVFVSHKKGFTAEPTKYGAKITASDGQTDYVFRNDKPITVNEDGLLFSGTAGFIRKKKELELVLFHGDKIGTAGYVLGVDNIDAGVSAVIDAGGFLKGKFFCPVAASVYVEWAVTYTSAALYIDGKKQLVRIDSNKLVINFPAGEHSWQITGGLPVPGRAEILYSENDRGKVNLFFAPSEGAGKYRIEVSTDQCETWKALAETAKLSYTVPGMQGLSKIHVRVRGINKEQAGAPTPAYPVYLTCEKPAYPDGLKANLQPSGAVLTWGQVLGCHTYKLYRRKQGDVKYEVIYTGKNSYFDDLIRTTGLIYEYAVAAMNKNGDSRLSNFIDTDPASWLHWDPKPGEKFRRTNTTFGVSKDSVYYPD